MASVKSLFSLLILPETDKSTVLSPTSTTTPPRISGLTLLLILNFFPSPTKVDFEIAVWIRFKYLFSNGYMIQIKKLKKLVSSLTIEIDKW